VKVWDQYKHIKCSDFVAWWNKLSAERKLEWSKKKEEVDLDLEKRIEQQLWDRESRRVK
jgi:hypothetical protein